MKKQLYLVSTPIGNYDDMTLRALKILTDVNFIICEEYKEARRLLSHFKIDKPLVSINEHNEKDFADEIALRILQGETAALISDCGTPLFSDPGHILVDLCISYNIEVIPVPGANSLLPALTGSGLDFEKFYYYGWLSPKKEIRQKELLQLKNKKELLVILDTPYRLKALLADIIKVFGKYCHVVVAFNLTLPSEKFFRASAQEILQEVEAKNLKGEFVLLLDNRKNGTQIR
ncbi:MAG: 16S rRNA (cytidine(1402)-2'-O)-methyltransferase [Ignavibacteriaceae bacterium]